MYHILHWLSPNFKRCTKRNFKVVIFSFKQSVKPRIWKYIIEISPIYIDSTNSIRFINIKSLTCNKHKELPQGSVYFQVHLNRKIMKKKISFLEKKISYIFLDILPIRVMAVILMRQIKPYFFMKSG